jgi:hypothetical protein
MTNRPAFQHLGRVDGNPTIGRLRDLAAQEAAATKERLATRTAAARLFSGAVARLAEARVAWQRAQTEAQRAQAEAIDDLVGSGMELGDVGELFGISKAELRSLRVTAHERPTKGTAR